MSNPVAVPGPVCLLGMPGGGEAVDPAHGLASCQLSEVPRVLEQVVDEEHKTPLFLDTSPERKVGR